VNRTALLCVLALLCFSRARAQDKEKTGTALPEVKVEVSGMPKALALVRTAPSEKLMAKFRIRIRNQGAQDVLITPSLNSPKSRFTVVLTPNVFPGKSSKTADIELTQVLETTSYLFPGGGTRLARLTFDVVEQGTKGTPRSEVYFEDFQVQFPFFLDLTFWLLVTTLLLAAVIVVVSVDKKPSGKSTWSAPIASPTLGFSPQESPASGFTFVGALVLGITGLTGFPGSESNLSSGSYGALAVIFTALVAVSPAVFRAPPGVGEGKTGFYALAMWFNLWGFLGQFGLILLLVEELAVSSFFTRSAVCLTQTAMVVLGFLIVSNGVKSIQTQTSGAQTVPASMI